MKPGSIGDLDIYLGVKLREVTLSNGVTCWSMSSAKYVKDAIRNVEEYIEEHLGGMKLKKKASLSWPSNYMIENNESLKLPSELASYYQHFMGVLHWIVKLG